MTHELRYDDHATVVIGFVHVQLYILIVDCSKSVRDLSKFLKVIFSLPLLFCQPQDTKCI